MRDGKYFAPAGVEEAVRILAEWGEKGTLLAGGTDLVPKINYYELRPEALIFLGGLGLDYVKESGGGLAIGAATTTARLAEDAMVAEKAGALAEAARLSGSDAIRNSATIGGNLANASPAADLATPLLVMDAEVLIKGSDGDRVLPLKEFFRGPGQTALKPQELLVEIRIPAFKGKTAFRKLGRRKAMTLSVVNVAVRLDGSGKKCNEARIALGSMAPTPMRCEKAEAMLQGKALDRELIKACAAQAVNESSPIDDQRATAWYRKQAGAALVAQALNLISGLDS
jgi:CO/xanthine dehydrogenase FAD-binding subunit